MGSESVFISHSTQDNVWCRTFVSALAAEGFDVWYDEQGLTGGTAWVTTLQREVQTRPIFIPILTPQAWDSRWVQEEIQLAIATQRTIVPVMLQPTQLSGFLMTRQWVDGIGKEGHVVAHQMAAILRTAVAMPATATPKQVVAAPQLVPPPLDRLGYVGQVTDGVEVLLPPLRTVPAGPFWMGTDPAREPEYAENESPFRQVQVSAFQLAAYPVTVAEYACAVRAGGIEAPEQWAKQQAHLDHPVVFVGLVDAWTYIHWLNQVSGHTFRLPTAEEWEKAARGADGRSYPWGNQWDRTRANTADGGPGGTTPVWAYAAGASPYGVCDMAGNVWEWCGLSPDSPLVRPGPVLQQTAQQPSYMYGGSWSESPRLARVAYRRRVGTGSPYDDTGLRLVYQAPL